MRTFNDGAGREWRIALTLGSAARVKDALSVDLLQPESGDPPLLTRLGTDELLLGEVICCLLADQFDKHKVTAEEVSNSFDGTTLLAAQSAFYEELVDFFLNRGRADRAKMVAAQAKAIEAAIRMAEARIDALDVDQAVSGVMSGDSPAPSASIPDR